MKSDSSYVLGLLLSLDSRLLCRSRLNLHITVQMRHAGQFKLFSTPTPSMSRDPHMACTIRISHLNLLNASRMHANISNGRLCTSDPLQCLWRCLWTHSLETNPYGTCSCFRIESASAGLAPKIFLPIIHRLQWNHLRTWDSSIEQLTHDQFDLQPPTCASCTSTELGFKTLLPKDLDVYRVIVWSSCTLQSNCDVTWVVQLQYYLLVSPESSTAPWASLLDFKSSPKGKSDQQSQRRSAPA